MENYGFLYVRTMGGFSIRWNDKPITISAKGEDTQFVRIMQILLHNYKSGVGRYQLQELLSNDSSSDDTHHLFRTVIYNARKKLRNAGLPDIPYIIHRDGMYYWTEQIPVKEDAERFEQLCAEVKSEKNDEQRLSKLMAACESYGGEFLPNQTRLAWVAKEDSRYKELFGEIVDDAAEVLRKRGDYTGLEKLGRYASESCPLNEKEILTLEGLSGNGRYIEAHNYYNEITDYYQRELGVDPSFGMLSKLEKILGNITQPRSLPELIADQLFETEKKTVGGYICTYPVFQGICRMIKRNKGRSESRSYLMICTLDTGKSPQDLSKKTMERYCRRMENALVDSVRKGDAVCRYGHGQYMVLLMDIDRMSCDIVRERIDSNFRSPRSKCTINYHMEAL